MITHSVSEQFLRIQEKLRAEATNLGNFRVVTQVPEGVSPDSLTGIYAAIWEYLLQDGLQPGIFTTINPPAVMGKTFPVDEPIHYIFACWHGEAPELFKFFAQELRCLRNASAWRTFAESAPQLAKRIELARERGQAATTVFRFSAMSKPTALFPFDGSETTLPELGQLTWRYLTLQGLTPVIEQRDCWRLDVSGIGCLTQISGAQIYKLLATW